LRRWQQVSEGFIRQHLTGCRPVESQQVQRGPGLGVDGDDLRTSSAALRVTSTSMRRAPIHSATAVRPWCWPSGSAGVDVRRARPTAASPAGYTPLTQAAPGLGQRQERRRTLAEMPSELTTKLTGSGPRTDTCGAARSNPAMSWAVPTCATYPRRSVTAHCE
jgi:hypothetical protein